MQNNFKIKDILIESRVILAPMAGITSFSYRKFYKPFGAGITYSEMISDCGLIYNNERTLKMCYSNGSDRPYAIQLFGGSKETLLKAIDILENSGIEYDFLDINLACPVPKVTKNNGGSSWLKDVDKMKDIMSEIVKKSKKPVTAKVRLGWEENNIINIAQALEEAGVSFLAIHCRTKKELYSGKPHYECLEHLKDYIKIPFGVSGNIYTLDDAKKAFEITKCDAILVARGGIGNPELIKTINLFFDGKEELIRPLDLKRQANYLLDFSNNLISEYGEKRAISILKGIAPKFFTQFDFAKSIRIEITSSLVSYESLKKIVSKYIEI